VCTEGSWDRAPFPVCVRVWVERKKKTNAAVGEGIERCFGGKRIAWLRELFVVGSPWGSWSASECIVRFRIQRTKEPAALSAVALGRICSSEVKAARGTWLPYRVGSGRRLSLPLGLVLGFE